MVMVARQPVAVRTTVVPDAVELTEMTGAYPLFSGSAATAASRENTAEERATGPVAVTSASNVTVCGAVVTSTTRGSIRHALMVTVAFLITSSAPVKGPGQPESPE